MNVTSVLEEKSHINQGFSGVRLTRRGIQTVRAIILIAALLASAFSYSALAGAQAGVDFEKSHVEVIVVAPGESLWSIAQIVGGDIDQAIAEIMELNALSKPNLAVGDRIIIPTRG
jgi:LysM repeat protein